MWISARDALPGFGHSCIVWTGTGKPKVAHLGQVMEVAGAWVTAWVGEDVMGGWRCALNEGHFWIRLPELPDL
jgi:hypothetical protein